MNFWVVGTDYKKSSLEQRVKSVIKEPDSRFRLVEGLEEKIWLATCNRVELYGVGDVPPEEVLDRWASLANLSENDIKHFHVWRDREALKHLFRVVSSLESMVLGENQIAGQVRRAYQEAVDLEWVGNFLHRSCQTAFHSAKRVRNETEVGQFAVSIPSIGVKMAQRVLGELDEKRVGVVGLGEIGRVAAEHFASVNPKKLLLHNRTQSVAAEMASELADEGIHVEAVETLSDVLDRSEVIVFAASELKLEEAEIRKIRNRQSQLFILDLGVPPTFPKYDDEHLFIYYVDDLKRISEENNRLREQEVQKAESILFQEVDKCWISFSAMSLGETFQRLSSKIQKIREEELSQLRRKLRDVAEDDWKEIEKMSQRLSSKLLQDPIVELKSRSQRDPSKENLLQLFRNMFRI